MLNWADRIRDTSTSNGTGSFTVSGTPPTNYNTFSARLAVNDTFYYVIVSQTAAEWEVGAGVWLGANQFSRANLSVLDGSSGPGVLVNFTPATKDVWLDYPAAGAAAVGVAANTNFVLNGAMEISQEFGATAVTTVTTRTYIVDMWRIEAVGGGVFTGQQTTDTPIGFKFSLKATVTTADAALAVTDKYTIFHAIEGYRVAPLLWGGSTAQSISIGFWVKVNRVGTYSGSIQNTLGNRSYPFNFTVVGSDTWEYKTVTIPGDTTGTWAIANDTGMYLIFCMASGTTNLGTVNTWAASNLVGVTGTINGVAALTDYMAITGVTMIRDSVPVARDLSPRMTQMFDVNLNQCRRYYQKSFLYATAPAQSAGTNTGEFQFIAISAGAVALRSGQAFFQPSMRTSPTMTFYNPAAANAEARDETAAADCSVTTTTQISENNFSVSCTGNGATAIMGRIGVHWTANARLV